MKVVDARLATGEAVIIDKVWFVDIVDRGADWHQASPVEAHIKGDVDVKVNPKFIVWARVKETKE